MKDFISKLTFGFLMAQFFPGAVVVFAVRCAIADRHYHPGDTLWHTISEVGPSLFTNTFTMVVLGLLAIGVGMCIHGMNWAVLAWLEHVSDVRHWKSVRVTLVAQMALMASTAVFSDIHAGRDNMAPFVCGHDGFDYEREHSWN